MGISRISALAQAKLLARRNNATIQNENDAWDRVLLTLTNRFNILRGTKTANVVDGVDLRSATVIGPEYKELNELPDGSGHVTAITDTARSVSLYRLELPDILAYRQVASGNGDAYWYSVQSGAGTDNLLLYPIPSGQVNLRFRYFYTHPPGAATALLPAEWNDAIIKTLAYELAMLVGDYGLAGIMDLNRPEASTGLGKIAAYAVWNAYKISHSRGRVVYHGF